MPWSYSRLACITLPAYNCVVVGFHIINSQISSNMMDEFGAKPKANNNDNKQPYKVRWPYQRLSVTVSHQNTFDSFDLLFLKTSKELRCLSALQHKNPRMAKRS